MNKEIETKILAALEAVRPSLQVDGGDVAFREFDPATGIVKVELQGMCKGCPMAEVTLKMYIEQELKESVPEVTEVQGV